MELEQYLARMVMLYTKEILSMIKEKERDCIIMKMENIILVNGKMTRYMEKENYIIKMVILNMKEILLMVA